MMTKQILIFSCLLFVYLQQTAFALPTKCLQAPERLNACPHFIYKKAALSVSTLGVEKGQIICICLSDLKALRDPATSKVEQIDQQVTLQRLAEKHQLTEQDILTLIRN